MRKTHYNGTKANNESLKNKRARRPRNLTQCSLEPKCKERFLSLNAGVESSAQESTGISGPSASSLFPQLPHGASHGVRGARTYKTHFLTLNGLQRWTLLDGIVPGDSTTILEFESCLGKRLASIFFFNVSPLISLQACHAPWSSLWLQGFRFCAFGRGPNAPHAPRASTPPRASALGG